MAKAGSKPKGGVEFTPEVYRTAAFERIGALQSLYDSGQYVLAIYTAGIALESMLRAYRATVNPEFSSRHDLAELARESQFADRVPGALWEKYTGDLGDLVLRWSNNHRYRSAVALRKFLKKARLDRGIKGDFLKENARIAINAAIALIKLGEQLWTA